MVENINLKDGHVKINSYYMRFTFCSKSRKRIKVLSDQLHRLQMENDNLYSQNNDLRIQIKNIEPDTINKPSQKRESLRPLSRPSRDESEIVYKRKLTENNYLK